MKLPVRLAANDHAIAVDQAVFLIGCDLADHGSALPEGACAQSMGFKAYNLLRMSRIGLPVPPAFVLSTGYCTNDESRGAAMRRATWAQALRALERTTARGFGDRRHPLLVSVRSGAPVSMPGMMETLLNVGLCETTLSGLLRLTGNPRMLWDSYRRLVQAYGEVVEGIDRQVFEQAYRELMGTRHDRDLDFKELEQVACHYLDAYRLALGRPFPQDPFEQLSGAIGAVLDSWQSGKAQEFRRHQGLTDIIGTAVTVQAMAFGNTGGTSGAGVGFTRDPVSGERRLCVDFLFNAQGEDVVSGRQNASGHEALGKVLPAVWQALVEAAQCLELEFADMQDIEFTVQDAQLFLLQTRSGKRTPVGARQGSCRLHHAANGLFFAVS